MHKYILIIACLVATHGLAMKPTKPAPQDKAQREADFEARMLAIREEQAKRATKEQFTYKHEQTEIPGIGTMHSGSIDFGEGISFEEFKKLFTQAQAEHVRENPQQKEKKKT